MEINECSHVTNEASGPMKTPKNRMREKVTEFVIALFPDAFERRFNNIRHQAYEAGLDALTMELAQIMGEAFGKANADVLKKMWEERR